MSTRTRKPSRATKSDWTKTFAKSALQLVEQVARRGLLADDEVAKLERSVEEVVDENSTAALAKVAQFHRRLASDLEDGDLSHAATMKTLDALLESNRILSATQDPAECCVKLIGHVRKLIPCDGATLHLVDRKSGRLNAVASAGPIVDLIDRIEFAQGIGFSGWVARTQKPVVFGSLKRSQPSHSGVIKSFMAAPLVVAGETIGVLNLGHAGENAFKKEDLRLLTLIAGQAGGMIQKVLSLEQMKEMAIEDELTGLYNRRHLLTRIQDEVARSSRFLQEFSVVSMDLDGFRRFNEAFGQETGDKALVELGQKLRSLVRSSDLVARYGGEEFVVLLPSTGRHEALTLAARIRSAIEAHTFPRRKRLSVSVGVATYPQDSTEPQELLNIADKALYQARRMGQAGTADLSALAA